MEWVPGDTRMRPVPDRHAHIRAYVWMCTCMHTRAHRVRHREAEATLLGFQPWHCGFRRGACCGARLLFRNTFRNETGKLE